MQKNLAKIQNEHQLEVTNTTVAVYNTQEEALETIKALEKSGIPVENISFISSAIIVADKLQSRSLENVKNAPVAIGAVLGPLLGVLAGVSIFAVPGLGFIYGAGAAVGAIAGFNLGLVGGGIGTLLMTLGIKKDKVIAYHKHLKEGKVLVILKGNEATATKAKNIAHKVGHYIELIIL